MDILAELKPQLEILEKVVKFEEKREFNRFLLVFTFAGFISIVGGWIEYVFYRLFGISSTFFIFGQTGESELAPTAEPILFGSIWLIYLIPISGIVIFTLGSPGFINWNKSYRLVGAATIILFLITHITIILIGIPNSKLIPGVWGTLICIGFLFASKILSNEFSNKSIQLGLIFFGLTAFILGLVSILLLPEELGMLFFCCVFGLLLTISGMITYFNVGRVNILPEGGS
ncbi:MAG: hypothetical protein ACFFAU_16765 [Candidatus Hodarchaeota archaeon]